MSSFLPLVAPGLLTVAGGALVVSCGRDIWFGVASRAWSTTRGKVVALETHEGTPWHGDSSVIVTYEYEVNGTAHRSHRFDFAGRNAGTRAGDVLTQMQVGEWLPVLYDPRRPQRATLHSGVGVQSITYALIGAAIAGLGLLGLVGSILRAPG